MKLIHTHLTLKNRLLAAYFSRVSCERVFEFWLDFEGRPNGEILEDSEDNKYLL